MKTTKTPDFTRLIAEIRTITGINAVDAVAIEELLAEDYHNALDSARDSAYDAGYDAGYEVGHFEGYDVGYYEGYDDGYSAV